MDLYSLVTERTLVLIGVFAIDRLHRVVRSCGACRLAENLEQRWVEGPAGRWRSRADTFGAACAERNDEQIILGIENPLKLPLEPLHLQPARTNAEDRVLDPLPVTAQQAIGAPPPSRITDVVRDEVPPSIGHQRSLVAANRPA